MSAKTIFIRDKQAIALVNERAAREHRSASNAAVVTLLEALHKSHKTPPSPPDLASLAAHKGQNTNRATGLSNPNSRIETEKEKA